MQVSHFLTLCLWFEIRASIALVAKGPLNKIVKGAELPPPPPQAGHFLTLCLWEHGTKLCGVHNI